VDSLQTIAAAADFPYDGAMTATSFKTWRYLAGPWLVLGLFDATQTVVSMRAMGMQHNWFTLFFVTLGAWAIWVAFTPVVLGLQRRFPLPARAAAPWAVHLLACLAIGATWAVWTALLEHTTNPFAYPQADPFVPLLRAKLLNNLVADFIIYGAVLAVSVTFDAHERLLLQRTASARLAELLAQAQLAALRLQLEPHFIFNALNAVTGLIREHKDKEAIAAIATLGDLLRRVTERSEAQFVTLADEIDFLHKYLDIQQLRFGDRLRCEFDLPAVLLAAQVPDFILQPLAENAIKHGIARRAKGGVLKVSAARAGEMLTLSVYNDGPLLAAAWQDGVGLANTRQRLRALYGEAQSLDLQDQAGNGVLATITLPYRQP
jgi:hypothetical protein